MRTGLVLLSILVVPGISACAHPKAAPSPQAATGEPANDELAAPPDVAAPPADSQKTASGLAYKVIKPGTGTKHPSASDTVTVNYTGWTPDGKMFDSSIPRGEPTSFPLNAVIKGWTEGVQLMVVGEKTRFWIPGPLAYGDTAKEDVPTGLLVFDVELLAIQ